MCIGESGVGLPEVIGKASLSELEFEDFRLSFVE